MLTPEARRAGPRSEPSRRGTAGSPAHPGHAQRGQLGERRRLRQAYDVHRAADLRGEAAQRVRLPQGDRVHAVDAGLEVGMRAPQRFGNELLLGPGAGAGEEGTEEDVDPGVDHERVAVRPTRPGEPPRATPRAGRGRGGCRRRGRCPRGCSRRPRRSAAQRPARPAPSRSRPRRRPSRAPRRPWRSARPRRASRRPAHPRGPRSRASRPRPRWWSRPRETQPRPRLSPWPRPRRSEAGGGRRGGAATAAGRSGSGGLLSVRRSCHESTPPRGSRAGLSLLRMPSGGPGEALGSRHAPRHGRRCRCRWAAIAPTGARARHRRRAAWRRSRPIGWS